jgi:hypothetical protein
MGSLVGTKRGQGSGRGTIHISFWEVVMVYIDAIGHIAVIFFLGVTVLMPGIGTV